MKQYTRICKSQYCEKEFTTPIRNKVYCSEDCLQLARKQTHKKYNKKRKKTGRIGTTNISENRITDFNEEYKEVHNELIRTLSFHKGKGKQSAWSYDRASLSLSYEMIDCNPCPHCHGEIRERNISRSEVVCKECGLVLYGPPIQNVKYEDSSGRMAATVYDVIISENTKDVKTGIKKSSIQDVAWTRFYNPTKYQETFKVYKSSRFKNKRLSTAKE